METPAGEEVNFSILPPPGRDIRQVLGTVQEARAELQRRGAAYPDIPTSLRARGVPVVGRTGALLNRLLREAGLDRDKIFLSNILRCFPVKSKKGDTYPTGADKTIAQSLCRMYDRIGTEEGKFSPDIILVTMHPASLFKDGASSAEPLILADLQKAVSFAADGLKVLVLMGGHAAEVMLGFGSTVAKWRGHYEWTQPQMYDWYGRRVEKLKAKADKAGRVKMPRVKKLTKAEVAREELAARIAAVIMKDFMANSIVNSIAQVGLEMHWTGLIVPLLIPPERAKKVKVKAPPVDTTPANEPSVCPPREVS